MTRLRWRIAAIVAMALVALYVVAPSILYFAAPREVRNSEEELARRVPDFLPQRHMSLGLDLQGGVQLVLGVDTRSAVTSRLDRVGTEAQRWSDQESAGIEEVWVQPDGALHVQLRPGVDVTAFEGVFAREFGGLTRTDATERSVDFAYGDAEVEHIRKGAVEQAERVIRSRVDKWGVTEPVITRRAADDSILVQLPGFKDPARAKEMLGRTAQLAFKLVDDTFGGFADASLPEGIQRLDNGGQSALVGTDRDALLKFCAPMVPANRQLLLQVEPTADRASSTFTTFVVDAVTSVSGEDVLDASVGSDPTAIDARPYVALKLTSAGARRFGEVTGENVGRRLAIVLDDEVVSAPVIQSKIPTGEASISMGGGTPQEAMDAATELATILKSGALPAKISVLEERQVGATLGPELADRGIAAALAGLGAVFLFMVAWYRRPGALACLALALNGLFLLALMASFGFALSLPGIAGFILTLGMAVDANVLINERIRQEIGDGRTPRRAVDVGFGKVFWTIFDANVTTMIAAGVLLATNDSGPIRGFAVTLLIGLVVSMFTSLVCTRAFFDLVLARVKTEAAVQVWLGADRAASPRRFNINFARIAPAATALSGVVLLAALLVGVSRGPSWGVDFAGGTEVRVRFERAVDAGDLRDAGSKADLDAVTLQEVGEGGREWLVRFGAENLRGGVDPAVAVDALKASIATSLASAGPEVLATDFVGPQIGAELRTQGLASLVYAIAGIFAYILLRFDVRFGPGAVLKMVHDAGITLAFYLFFDRTIDLTTVAAFLTVIGYSVNDVVVIYDRIRENLASNPQRPLVDTINTSLNETLTRSLLTSVVTILSLAGLVAFGTGSIQNFALAMVVGVCAATFSSTFIASFALLWVRAGGDGSRGSMG